ncbi:DUF4097 family beta strand repeat-containing protein [Streptomyces sp. MST-110588]|uniref:DUF4097 family beta strand repeat-containing protein n=1 Tax=Streptomyces sp. MST-110588 TaxID=2833628 RepID=UPI001F5D4C51|nr:DUF4097 family beta strand repeat-containing protein [Streptomyces sp. MST-110588]UNO39990.1 DUF4097 family beta strand repeat protein [Streptomyces sp. MST-110588]
MRRHLRHLAAIALVGVAVGGVSSCGLWDSSTFEDDGKVSQKITSVRLDNGSGAVEVRGEKDVDEISVHRKVEYRGDRPEGASHRVENGVLILGGCGKSCSVSYTVEVPVGTRVGGQTSNGAVTLSQVGEVDVTTSNGAVKVDDAAGPVKVRTTNGRITGRGLKGKSIDAETSNGGIELAPATAQDIRAETTNGAVSLTVPAGRYRISAKNDNGHQSIGIPNDPSGDHRIDLTTDNGAITVKAA